MKFAVVGKREGPNQLRVCRGGGLLSTLSTLSYNSFHEIIYVVKVNKQLRQHSASEYSRPAFIHSLARFYHPYTLSSPLILRTGYFGPLLERPTEESSHAYFSCQS